MLSIMLSSHHYIINLKTPLNSFYLFIYLLYIPRPEEFMLAMSKHYNPCTSPPPCTYQTLYFPPSLDFSTFKLKNEQVTQFAPHGGYLQTLLLSCKLSNTKQLNKLIEAKYR